MVRHIRGFVRNKTHAKFNTVIMNSFFYNFVKFITNTNIILGLDKTNFYSNIYSGLNLQIFIYNSNIEDIETWEFIPWEEKSDLSIINQTLKIVCMVSIVQ